MADEVVEEYRSSLDDLTFNSKPLISMLTMLADDHVQYAAEIVQVIEAHIQKILFLAMGSVEMAKPTEKLPALYLLDSIIKNISDSSYPRLFSQNLVSMFCGVFEKVDEKTRQAMWKLRQTWVDIIPNKRLYALDIRIQMIDPAWPVTAQPPEEPISSIHVNPKFLIKDEADAKAKKDQEEQEALMRQQLLAKQQELLKLQQERLELELAEAKARLVSQAKQIESQPTQLPGQSAPIIPKALTTPKVESEERGSGSPVNIPTIAVQGIMRDPRGTPRDPRLPQADTDSRSPTKELGPAAPQVKSAASTRPAAAHTGSPAPRDIAATPSESAKSKPKHSTPPPRPAAVPHKAAAAPHKAAAGPPKAAPPRHRDDRARDPKAAERTDKAGHSSKSSSSGGGRKKASPAKSRQSDKKEPVVDKKPPSSSADRHSLESRDRRNKHGPPSSSGGGSSRPGHRGHRLGSRSCSPEKDNKVSSSRSRSRSPRRSPRGGSAERKDHRPRDPPAHARDPPAHARESEKRQRSPDADVVVIDHDDHVPAPDDGEFSGPPSKKTKPEEATDSVLPADFRELFGNEDQDYRRLPATPTGFSKVPTTPPTPGTPSSGRWAQFKAERPQEFPFQQPRATVDMPSPGSHFQDVDMRSPPLRRMSASQPNPSLSPGGTISRDQLNINIPAPLMLEQLDSILTEADAQLQSGNLTHEKHQTILKQLGELQKLQRLKLQLQTRGVDDEDHRPPRPVDNPFQMATHNSMPPVNHMEDRSAPHFDNVRLPDAFNREPGPQFGIEQREPPQPPHMADAPPFPPRPDFPDQDLRDRPPGPNQGMPPMMRPPLPPHLAGLRQQRPRAPRPGLTGPPPRPYMNRNPMAHLTSGQLTLPYDTAKYYIPDHDPRWVTLSSDAHQHKLYIDDKAYELPLGCPPRQIQLGDGRVQISIDTSSRGIKIDGICYYKIGDQPRKVTINGSSYVISYKGSEKKIWIDEEAFEVFSDGPPQPIFIGGKEHSINIDSIMNQVIIDDQVVCPFGGPMKQIEIGYNKHEVQFEPPPRKILIDNKLYEMNFKGKHPCVNTEGVDFGIRFDGPPREIIINEKQWTVPMDIPRKARFATERIHVVAFGGPGHEVIINGQWYEIKFNGPEKTIRLGTHPVRIRLVGPPPEVKILGQVVSDPVKIQELVGDAYIDPSIAVMSKPPHGEQNQTPDIGQPHFDEGPRSRMGGPDMPPRHMMPRGGGIRPPRMPDMGRGMPPRMQGGRGGGRGGYRDGPHQQPHRGLPPHMDDRGRGSPPYEEGGRNSPNNLDNFGPMHNMEPDRPQMLHHRQEGPRPHFQPHGQRPPFGGQGGRGFRGPPPRMRGGRGPRMGRRDDFYQPGPHGGMRGAGPPHRMHGPPHNGPPPRDDFNNFFRPPPQPEMPYGGMPNLPPPPQPTFASQIDVNDLFGKLVSSGIIKKATEEPAAPPPIPAVNSPSAAPQNGKEEKKPEEAPKPQDVKPKEPEIPKPPVIVKPKEKLPEVPDMTDFNLDKMKTRHMTVVQKMYGGIQCSSCGVRFITDDMDKYREHLDWHFRQNRRDKDGVKVAKFRQWYYTTNEWIQFEEIIDLEERAHSMYFEKLLQTQQLPGSTGALQVPETPISCPAATGNANDDVCEMCGEQFENFFDEDTEEWCLRDAIRVGTKTYHPACYEDVKENSIVETPTPEAETSSDPVTNPLAFLSKLTGSNQPAAGAESTTEPTETTETKIKLEVPESQESETLPPPQTAAVKTEPLTPAPAVQVKTEEDVKPVTTVVTSS